MSGERTLAKEPERESDERKTRKTQPGGRNGLQYNVPSVAVSSDRSSAVAAAPHSLTVKMRPAVKMRPNLFKMRPPPQEPLSIM